MIMTKPAIVALAVTAMVALTFWWPIPPPPRARIKIENDGGIILGSNHPDASAMPYDPYFTHVNDAPHIQISCVASAGVP